MRAGIAGADRGTASRERDPWDDDPNWDDEEQGPSWTKKYVGGVKVRDYGFMSQQAGVREAGSDAVPPA